MTDMPGLLGALFGIPALPGARCRGRPHLFDEARPDEAPEVAAQRHAQALTLCADCPSLIPCVAYVENLPPSKRPLGVTAGKIRTERKKRKAKPA